MLHYKHVLFPQVAESTPARLALREGVALHPPPAGIVVEVAARVHRPIQAPHDNAGHSNARLAQTEPRVTCRAKPVKEGRKPHLLMDVVEDPNGSWGGGSSPVWKLWFYTLYILYCFSVIVLHIQLAKMCHILLKRKD